MQIVSVEIYDQRTLQLLQTLEELNVLRIVNGSAIKDGKKLSDNYNGVFSKEDADSFNKHTKAMREEWNT